MRFRTLLVQLVTRMHCIGAVGIPHRLSSSPSRSRAPARDEQTGALPSAISPFLLWIIDSSNNGTFYRVHFTWTAFPSMEPAKYVPSRTQAERTRCRDVS